MLEVTPVRIPGETPARTLEVTPVRIPGETPARTLAVTPARTPGETPGETPAKKLPLLGKSEKRMTTNDQSQKMMVRHLGSESHGLTPYVTLHLTTTLA